MRNSTLVAMCLVLCTQSWAVCAATVWTGPLVTFAKDNSSTIADILTPNVSLTRGAVQFLYNPSAGELGASPSSPLDTEWAFAGLDGNPTNSTFSATNFTKLNFSSFVSALGGPGPAGGGSGGILTTILNRPGVLHLISDDIYLDIQFSVWNPGGLMGNAAIEYARSSVPIPASLPLISGALGVLAWRRQHNPAVATTH